MTSLRNVPRGPDATWRLKLYRVDKDTSERATWAWRPTEHRFHEYAKFGKARFMPRP